MIFMIKSYKFCIKKRRKNFLLFQIKLTFIKLKLTFWVYQTPLPWNPTELNFRNSNFTSRIYIKYNRIKTLKNVLSGRQMFQKKTFLLWVNMKKALGSDSGKWRKNRKASPRLCPMVTKMTLLKRLPLLVTRRSFLMQILFKNIL